MHNALKLCVQLVFLLTLFNTLIVCVAKIVVVVQMKGKSTTSKSGKTLVILENMCFSQLNLINEWQEPKGEESELFISCFFCSFFYIKKCARSLFFSPG